ncbi:MAG: hypothetical protein IH994_12580, partial [Proteobacteria bacterium]|nr:hypothetical protein [Pseudomonadota bacterium]
ALNMVHQIASDPEIGLPISGIGGIQAWQDAVEHMLLGASGVLATGGILLALLWPAPMAVLTGFALMGVGAANMVPIFFITASRLPGVPAAEGIAAAVVSMPCWELFDQQDEDYRQEVLGPVAPRVAVEAAVRQGWDRYIRSHGGFVGMTGFGASAPAGDLFKHFGITADAVITEVRKRLA